VCGDFMISRYPKSLGGLYAPGPGESLGSFNCILAAVPNRLVAELLNCEST
jgi:hypothetical protein